MHNEQAEFILAVREVLPRYFHGAEVLEVGSYNINGTVRHFFTEPKRYIGTDLIEGPCVDFVCSGENYPALAPFDTVISTECFEHAPNFVDIFVNMVRNTKPGGLVIFTCATEGRREHGTSRTSPTDSPGTVLTGSEHYRNVTAADFTPEDLSGFAGHRFYINIESCDLYFAGIKVGGKLPADDILFDLIQRRAGRGVR